MSSSPSARVWKPETDLHCHILPAWDDGPRDLESSLAMIERAQQSGLKRIVATPHVGRRFGGREKAASEIEDGVAVLQGEINARGLEIEIVTGAELMMGEVDIRARVPSEKELSYARGGRFCLIESPFPVWPPFGRSVVDALLGMGVTPVLAHPERYGNVQQDPKLLEPLVSSGALVQLTADAVVGALGKSLQTTCRRILESGWTAFVASDAHSTRETLPLDAVDAVANIVGEEAAQQIFVENPARLLAGERVWPPTVEKPAARGFLGRILGR